MGWISKNLVSEGECSTVTRRDRAFCGPIGSSGVSGIVRLLSLGSGSGMVSVNTKGNRVLFQVVRECETGYVTVRGCINFARRLRMGTRGEKILGGVRVVAGSTGTTVGAVGRPFRTTVYVNSARTLNKLRRALSALEGYMGGNKCILVNRNC